MYNRCEFFNTVWGWVLLLLLVRLSYTQEIFTARIVSSNPGTQFIPVIMPAQLISTMLTDSFKKCSILCTSNILCRVFDYQASVPKQCRLFEGDTNTLGQIASSSFSQSNVGIVQFSPALFAEYGSACSFSCPHSRYLQCSINFTCECMPHTYWNASVSMCVPQSPILGAPCQQNMSMCREDINYTCLQFNQCGRKFHEYFSTEGAVDSRLSKVDHNQEKYISLTK
jgi:hypothetical protein